MYAVIVSGGKQHRVQEGEVVRLEKLDTPTGEKVAFDQVLMVGSGTDVKLGTPVLDGTQVEAEVVEHGRADKVTIIKFRRRKHSMKRQGHRQWYTDVKITAIGGVKSKPKAKASAKKAGGDDLTKVEGIGPKIAATLTAAGVSTFAELAKTDTDKIAEIIADVRGSHNPGTWPRQADMAAQGKWDELKVWQDEMDGGVE